MKNPVFATAALILCIGLASCTPPLSMVNTDRLTKLAEMKKDPCLGQCPVFKLTLYNNGVVSYKGERYTDKVGLYLKRLSKLELEGIAAAFRRADLRQYDYVYRSEARELPAVSITYYEGDYSKTILGKETRPAAVLELETRLDAIAISSGWILRSAPDYDLPTGAIPNQLVVELREEANPEAWVRNYARQEMKLVKKIWPSNTKLLVSYNLKVVNPSYMIDLVRQDADVVAVEFNRK